MFERFTDRARRVIILAQEEARMLNHKHIGPEHILLGLLHEGGSVAYQALQASGVTLEATRQRIAESLGRDAHLVAGHIPFTPRARKVLENSLRQALQLGHNWIGAEHLLLALVRDEDAARTVTDLTGLDPDAIRRHVMEALPGSALDAAASRRSERIREVAAHLACLVRLSLPPKDIEELMDALRGELGVAEVAEETAA